VKKVRFFSREGELISEIPVPEETCKELLKLPEKELLTEVAINLSLVLDREFGMKLKPDEILRELGKVEICGKEVNVEGGNPAR